jgi:phenylalanyl-tRNA synthetase beta chain
MRLFDVFESEKLGADKKSMAISFLFSDDEKTLTDKEVDGMVAKLIQGFESELWRRRSVEMIRESRIQT